MERNQKINNWVGGGGGGGWSFGTPEYSVTINWTGGLDFIDRINFKNIFATKLFCAEISATFIFSCEIKFCGRIRFASYSTVRSLTKKNNYQW